MPSCAKMYVAAIGGQCSRHLENVASCGIRKYSVVFLDPQNPNFDTKIITVAILEVKINVKMCLAAILDAILKKRRNYIFRKCFIVFLDQENPIIDTRINVVDTIDAQLCAKMYVAAIGGQCSRHLENVASCGIRKYSVVFLDPQNPNFDTKIITVAALEVKICVKMCLAFILAAILDFIKTQQNFNTNLRI